MWVKRAVAFITLIAFSLTNSSYAQSVSFSDLAVEVSEPAAFSGEISVPEELGSIQEQHQNPSSKKFIVILQDAHAILDAQNHIQGLIRHFQETYGIDLVVFEGGEGALDPTLFRTFPDEGLKKKVLGEYLKRGELTGAAMAAVFNPKEAKYVGMEDWNLYEENYLAYLKADQVKEGVLKKLGELKSELDNKRRQMYSPELSQLHEQTEAFRDGRTHLLEFLKFISTLGADYENYPNIKALIASIEQDKTLNQENLDVTLRHAAEDFLKHLSKLGKSEVMIFNEKRQAYLTGRLDAGAFLEYLVEAGRLIGLDPKLTPLLETLFKSHQTLSVIKGTKLFDELEHLIRDLEAKRAALPAEIELLGKYKQLRLVRDLASLELTRDQWDEYQAAPSPLKGEGWGEGELQPALEFYRLAFLRDLAFHKNLESILSAQKKNSAVVLAGGFHSEGFKRFLKNSGFSYVLVTPKINSLEGERAYQNVMQGNLSYKEYLDTTFYDAFAKHASARLMSELNEPAFRNGLKFWRDEVIRKLSRDGRITEAANYTRYIDLLGKVYQEKFESGFTPKSRDDILKEIDSELAKFRKETDQKLWSHFQSQLREFTAGLRTLIEKKELNIQNVQLLLGRAGQSSPFAVVQLANVPLLKEAKPSPKLRAFLKTSTLPQVGTGRSEARGDEERLGALRDLINEKKLEARNENERNTLGNALERFYGVAEVIADYKAAHFETVEESQAVFDAYLDLVHDLLAHNVPEAIVRVVNLSPSTESFRTFMDGIERGTLPPLGQAGILNRTKDKIETLNHNVFRVAKDVYFTLETYESLTTEERYRVDQALKLIEQSGWLKDHPDALSSIPVLNWEKLDLTSLPYRLAARIIYLNELAKTENRQRDIFLSFSNENLEALWSQSPWFDVNSMPPDSILADLHHFGVQLQFLIRLWQTNKDQFRYPDEVKEEIRKAQDVFSLFAQREYKDARYFERSKEARDWLKESRIMWRQIDGDLNKLTKPKSLVPPQMEAHLEEENKRKQKYEENTGKIVNGLFELYPDLAKARKAVKRLIYPAAHDDIETILSFIKTFPGVREVIIISLFEERNDEQIKNMWERNFKDLAEKWKVDISEVNVRIIKGNYYDKEVGRQIARTSSILLMLRRILAFFGIEWAHHLTVMIDKRPGHYGELRKDPLYKASILRDVLPGDLIFSEFYSPHKSPDWDEGLLKDKKGGHSQISMPFLYFWVDLWISPHKFSKADFKGPVRSEVRSTIETLREIRAGVLAVSIALLGAAVTWRFFNGFNRIGWVDFLTMGALVGFTATWTMNQRLKALAKKTLVELEKIEDIRTARAARKMHQIERLDRVVEKRKEILNEFIKAWKNKNKIPHKQMRALVRYLLALKKFDETELTAEDDWLANESKYYLNWRRRLHTNRNRGFVDSLGVMQSWLDHGVIHPAGRINSSNARDLLAHFETIGSRLDLFAKRLKNRETTARSEMREFLQERLPEIMLFGPLVLGIAAVAVHFTFRNLSAFLDIRLIRRLESGLKSHPHGWHFWKLGRLTSIAEAYDYDYSGYGKVLSDTEFSVYRKTHEAFDVYVETILSNPNLWGWSNRQKIRRILNISSDHPFNPQVVAALKALSLDKKAMPILHPSLRPLERAIAERIRKGGEQTTRSEARSRIVEKKIVDSLKEYTETVSGWQAQYERINIVSLFLIDPPDKMVSTALSLQEGRSGDPKKWLTRKMKATPRRFFPLHLTLTRALVKTKEGEHHEYHLTIERSRSEARRKQNSVSDREILLEAASILNHEIAGPLREMIMGLQMLSDQSTSSPEAKQKIGGAVKAINKLLEQKVKPLQRYAEVLSAVSSQSETGSIEKVFLRTIVRLRTNPTLAKILNEMEVMESRPGSPEHELLISGRAGVQLALQQIVFYQRYIATGTFTGRPERVNLADLINLLRDYYGPNTISLSLDQNLLVMIDPAYFLSVLDNLIRNARAAGAKQIVISAKHQKQNIKITVSDDGRGIDPKLLPDKFFEKGVSTKGSTGLGLYFAKSIVEAAAGTTKAKNNAGKRGAVFTISLPAATRSESRGEESAGVNHFEQIKRKLAKTQGVLAKQGMMKDAQAKKFFRAAALFFPLSHLQADVVTPEHLAQQITLLYDLFLKYVADPDSTLQFKSYHPDGIDHSEIYVVTRDRVGLAQGITAAIAGIDANIKQWYQTTVAHPNEPDHDIAILVFEVAKNEHALTAEDEALLDKTIKLNEEQSRTEANAEHLMEGTVSMPDQIKTGQIVIPRHYPGDVKLVAYDIIPNEGLDPIAVGAIIEKDLKEFNDAVSRQVASLSQFPAAYTAEEQKTTEQAIRFIMDLRNETERLARAPYHPKNPHRPSALSIFLDLVSEVLQEQKQSGGKTHGLSAEAVEMIEKQVVDELMKSFKAVNPDDPEVEQLEAINREQQMFEMALERAFEGTGQVAPDIASMMTAVKEDVKRQVLARITRENLVAAVATERVVTEVLRAVRNSGDEKFIAKMDEIKAVMAKVIRIIKNESVEPALLKSVSTGSDLILFAEDMEPFELINFIEQYPGIVAIVSNQGSNATHWVLVAADRNIPVFVVDSKAKINLKDQNLIGRDAIVDGSGLLVINPAEATKKEYQQLVGEKKEYEALITALAKEPAVTRFGKRMYALANVDNVEELSDAFSYGAEGVGLFRTEYLFRKANVYLVEYLKEPSSENRERLVHYFEALFYDMAIHTVNGALTIRMLDLQRDKTSDLDPKAYNPSAVYGPDYYRTPLGEELLKIELEGALGARLKTEGKSIRILFPMFRSPIDLAKRLGRTNLKEPLSSAEQEQLNELTREDIKFMGSIFEEIQKKVGMSAEYGFMLETLEGLFEFNDLIEHAHFISIGTNDLITSLFRHLGISREKNPEYYNQLRPEVLQTVEHVTEILERKNKERSANGSAPILLDICGALAASQPFALFMSYLPSEHVQIELSGPPGMIPSQKQFIRGVDREDITLFDHLGESGFDVHQEAVRAVANIVRRQQKQVRSEARTPSAESSDIADLDIYPWFDLLVRELKLTQDQRDILEDFISNQHAFAFAFKSPRALLNLAELLFSPKVDWRLVSALDEFEGTYGLIDSLTSSDLLTGQPGLLYGLTFAAGIEQERREDGAKRFKVEALSLKTKSPLEQVSGTVPDGIVRDLVSDKTYLVEFKSVTGHRRIRGPLKTWDRQTDGYLRTILTAENSEIYPPVIFSDPPRGLFLGLGDSLIQNRAKEDVEGTIQRWFAGRVQAVYQRLKENGAPIVPWFEEAWSDTERRKNLLDEMLVIRFFPQPNLVANDGTPEQANQWAMKPDQWAEAEKILESGLRQQFSNAHSGPRRDEIYRYFMNADPEFYKRVSKDKVSTDFLIYGRYLQLAQTMEERKQIIRGGKGPAAPTRSEARSVSENEWKVVARGKFTGTTSDSVMDRMQWVNAVKTLYNKKRDEILGNREALLEDPQRYSDLVDEFAIYLFEEFEKRFPEIAAHMALFAVGGTGRREMTPSSDIDLRIAIEPSSNPAMNARLDQALSSLIVDFNDVLGTDLILRSPTDPLYLKGSSIRKKEKVWEMATEFFHPRIIAGNDSVYAMLQKNIQKTLDRHRNYLAGRLIEARNDFFKDSGQLEWLSELEPNLKNMLRHMHFGLWIVGARLGVTEDPFAFLVKQRYLEAREVNQALDAYRFILKVRMVTGYVSGKKGSTILPLNEQRSKIALLLGYQNKKKTKDHPAEKAEEALLKDLNRSAHQLFRFSTRMIGLISGRMDPPIEVILEQNKKLNTKLVRRWSLFSSLDLVENLAFRFLLKFLRPLIRGISLIPFIRQLLRPFVWKEKNMLVWNERRLFNPRRNTLIDPDDLIPTFQYAAENNAEISPELIRRIEESVELFRSKWRYDEEFKTRARRQFLKLLSSPHNVSHVLWWIKLRGLLSIIIPGYEKLIGKAAVDFTQEHTRDVVSMEEMALYSDLLFPTTGLWEKEARAIPRKAVELVNKNEMLRRTTRLALLLHTMYDDDPAGMKKALESFTYKPSRDEEYVLNPEDEAFILWLHEHNHRIVELMRRRAFRHTATFQNFVREEIIRQLQDETGPNINPWGAWSALLLITLIPLRLLRPERYRLYQEALRPLFTIEPEVLLGDGKALAQWIENERRDRASMLEQQVQGWIKPTEKTNILIIPFEENGARDGNLAELIVHHAAKDQPGRGMRIHAALAANGLEVLTAEIGHIGAQGYTFDRFVVRDSRFGLHGRTWISLHTDVSEDLQTLLNDKLQENALRDAILSAFAKRPEPKIWRSKEIQPSFFKIPKLVKFDADEPDREFSWLELRGRDRKNLLLAIMLTVGLENINIMEYSTVDTRGRPTAGLQAVDTFGLSFSNKPLDQEMKRFVKRELSWILRRDEITPEVISQIFKRAADRQKKGRSEARGTLNIRGENPEKTLREEWDRLVHLYETDTINPENIEVKFEREDFSVPYTQSRDTNWLNVLLTENNQPIELTWPDGHPSPARISMRATSDFKSIDSLYLIAPVGRETLAFLYILWWLKKQGFETVNLSRAGIPDAEIMFREFERKGLLIHPKKFWVKAKNKIEHGRVIFDLNYIKYAPERLSRSEARQAPRSLLGLAASAANRSEARGKLKPETATPEESLKILDETLTKIKQEMKDPGSTDLPRYLVVSDLHGNVERLKQILEDAKRKKVNRILLLGDLYSGPGGWTLYQMIQPYVASEENPHVEGIEIIPFWGNHELIFVRGMLGHNDNLYSFLASPKTPSFVPGLNQAIGEHNKQHPKDVQPTVDLNRLSEHPEEVFEQARKHPDLVKMAQWIQKTHRIFESDIYGTSYLHALPAINDAGRLNLHFEGAHGTEALDKMEVSLRNAQKSEGSIFSVLSLHNPLSPLWSMFSIGSDKQFDQAAEGEFRQAVVGHNHDPKERNLWGRQINIGSDFDHDRGVYLLVGPEGLRLEKFSEAGSVQVQEETLVDRQTHLKEITNFLSTQIRIQKIKIAVNKLDLEGKKQKDINVSAVAKKLGIRPRTLAHWAKRNYINLAKYGVAKDARSETRVERTLEQIIIDEINRSPDKKISWERFHALTQAHPVHGFYASGKVQFGHALNNPKDAVTIRTNAENPLVGLAFAKQFYDFWIDIGMPETLDIMEIGGGDGRMARHILDGFLLIDGDALRQKLKYIKFGKWTVTHPVILQAVRIIETVLNGLWRMIGLNFRFHWLKKYYGMDVHLPKFVSDKLPAGTPQPKLYPRVRYTIVDISPDLSRCQRQTLSEATELAGTAHFRPGEDKIRFINGLATHLPFKDGAVNGIVFSHELVDAFSPRIVFKRAGQLKELYVTYRNGKFEEVEGKLEPAERERILEYFELGGFTPEDSGAGPRKELAVNLHLMPFMEELYRVLGKGFAVTADYGFERPFYDNRAVWNYDEPNRLNLGIDLTHNVDFGTARKIGVKMGLDHEHLGSLRGALSVFDFIGETANPDREHGSTQYGEYLLIQSKGVQKRSEARKDIDAISVAEIRSMRKIIILIKKGQIEKIKSAEELQNAFHVYTELKELDLAEREVLLRNEGFGIDDISNVNSALWGAEEALVKMIYGKPIENPRRISGLEARDFAGVLQFRRREHLVNAHYADFLTAEGRRRIGSDLKSLMWTNVPVRSEARFQKEEEPKINESVRQSSSPLAMRAEARANINEAVFEQIQRVLLQIGYKKGKILATTRQISDRIKQKPFESKDELINFLKHSSRMGNADKAKQFADQFEIKTESSKAQSQELRQEKDASSRLTYSEVPVRVLLGPHATVSISGDLLRGWTDQAFQLLTEQLGKEEPDLHKPVVIWIESAFGGLNVTPDQMPPLMNSLAEELGISRNQAYGILLRPEEIPSRFSGFIKAFDSALLKRIASLRGLKGENRDLTVMGLAERHDDLGSTVYYEFFRNFYKTRSISGKIEIAPSTAIAEHVKGMIALQVADHMFRTGQRDFAIQDRFSGILYDTKSCLLRDRQLARDISEEIKRSPGALHVVLRGSAHTKLAKLVAEQGIRSSTQHYDDFGVDIFPPGELLRQTFLKDAANFENNLDRMLRSDFPLSREQKKLVIADFLIDALYLYWPNFVIDKDHPKVLKFLNNLSLEEAEKWLNQAPVASKKDDPGYYIRLGQFTHEWLSKRVGFKLPTPPVRSEARGIELKQLATADEILNLAKSGVPNMEQTLMKRAEIQRADFGRLLGQALDKVRGEIYQETTAEGIWNRLPEILKQEQAVLGDLLLNELSQRLNAVLARGLLPPAFAEVSGAPSSILIPEDVRALLEHPKAIEIINRAYAELHRESLVSRQTTSLVYDPALLSGLDDRGLNRARQFFTRESEANHMVVLAIWKGVSDQYARGLAATTQFRYDQSDRITDARLMGILRGAGAETVIILPMEAPVQLNGASKLRQQGVQVEASLDIEPAILSRVVEVILGSKLREQLKDDNHTSFPVISSAFFQSVIGLLAQLAETRAGREALLQAA